MSKINPLVQWWLSQKLPARHMVVDRDKLQDSHFKNIIIYVKHYFIHPVKRRIAKYYLVILKKVFNLKVIGITGSAGKTTTKDMLHSILKRNGRVVSSYKNIDPVYNIPSTILRCTPFTTYLVLEMGVEFPGEMDFYLWLVKPNVGVITNISVAHTEFFGDIGGVFREKSKLVKSLTGNDVSVLFREDKQLEKLEYKLRSKVEWFGDGSDVGDTLSSGNGAGSSAARAEPSPGHDTHGRGLLGDPDDDVRGGQLSDLRLSRPQHGGRGHANAGAERGAPAAVPLQVVGAVPGVGGSARQ